jgi:hypothetical protein
MDYRGKPRDLRILAVGSFASSNLVRDAILLRHRARLLVATNYRELCSLSSNEAEHVSVAVLEVSTSHGELLRKAEYVRRRWPDAPIVVVGSSAGPLEDPLYDDRVLPGITPTEMLAIIERLLKQKQLAKRARKDRIARGKSSGVADGLEA